MQNEMDCVSLSLKTYSWITMQNEMDCVSLSLKTYSWITMQNEMDCISLSLKTYSWITMQNEMDCVSLSLQKYSWITMQNEMDCVSLSLKIYSWITMCDMQQNFGHITLQHNWTHGFCCYCFVGVFQIVEYFYLMTTMSLNLSYTHTNPNATGFTSAASVFWRACGQVQGHKKNVIAVGVQS